MNPTDNSNCVFLGDDRILVGWYPNREELSAIIARGYDVYISLVTPAETTELGCYVNSVRAVISNPIFVTYPIVDGHIPTDLEGFRKLLQLILFLNKQGRKIYLHCRGGHGRAGVVIACLYKELGMSSTEALMQVQERHRERKNQPDYPTPQTVEQIQFIYDYTVQL